MKAVMGVFAAALMLVFAAMAWSAPHAQAREARIQCDAQPMATAADELSAGKRKWKRHGWHGKRKWKRHGWRGHRKWRGHRWHGRGHWRGSGRCFSLLRSGGRVIVYCRR